MHINPKLCRNLAIGGVLFGLVATPSFAIFGLGDIVWDPTNYAEMVTQASTAYSHYQAFKSNLQHFRGKNIWQTAQSGLALFQAADRFGETAHLTKALNTSNLQTAMTAWSETSITMQGAAEDFMHGQPLNGAHSAMLAMVEASDAVSPNCLRSIGAYQQNRAANANAEQELQNTQLDDNDDTNTEVQQLNLLNASQAQHMAELQSQGAVHACIASQMTVANMQQRNAAADDLNTKGFVAQQHQTNSAYPTGGSDTWTTYLP